MSEETNLPLTILPILTSLRTVTGRVKPAFEDAVSELTVVAAGAGTGAAVLGADGAGVMKPARVAATGLLAGVGEGAVGPVVAAAASAAADLELVDTEVVGGVRVGVRVGVGVGVVEREEFVESGDVFGEEHH